MVWLAVLLSTGASHAASGGPSDWDAKLSTPSTTLQSCRTLAAARGLSNALNGAAMGRADAFPSIRTHVNLLVSHPAPSDGMKPLIHAVQASATQFLAQKETLLTTIRVQQEIPRVSEKLLEDTEVLMVYLAADGARPAELVAVSQLQMLSQRLSLSAQGLSLRENISPEAVFLLRKDTNSFYELANGLLKGSEPLRLRPVKNKQTRDALEKLLRRFSEVRDSVNQVLGSLKGLVEAYEYRAFMLADLERLDSALARDCMPEGR
jgi:twitching motility protein PilJ